MNNIFIDISLFFVAIFMHELAHYVTFKLFGITPKIKFDWLKISIESPAVYGMKAREFFYVLVSGVFVGFIFLPNNNLLLMVYIIACLADISQIIMLLPHLKEQKTIMEININEIKQAKKEYKEWKKNQKQF